MTDPRKLYDQWVEAWNGNPDVLPAIIAPEFVIHQARFDGTASEDVRGPEAAARMLHEAAAPFPKLHMTVDAGPAVDGDLVAARWTLRGTYQGGMPGATAAPGTEVVFSGIDLFRVESGKFVEYWVSSDGVHLMAQLGMLPGP
jgi:predicted ester cyclase